MLTLYVLETYLEDNSGAGGNDYAFLRDDFVFNIVQLHCDRPPAIMGFVAVSLVSSSASSDDRNSIPKSVLFDLHVKRDQSPVINFDAAWQWSLAK